MDRLANAGVCAASTERVFQRQINLRIGRLGISFQQKRDRHDMARNAKTALADVLILEGLLDRMQTISPKPFDRGYVRADGLLDRNLAGPDQLVVHMNVARTTLRDAAGVFCSGQADMFAQDPLERRVRRDIDCVHLAVNRKTKHGFDPFRFVLGAMSPTTRSSDQYSLATYFFVADSVHKCPPMGKKPPATPVSWAIAPRR